jgi:alpha-L-fucosidase
LREVGQWLAKNGDAIYGTRGGPITPRPWGVTTHKGTTVYVHILDWQDPALLLPRLPKPIKAAHYLKTGEKAEYAESNYGLIINIPQRARDDFDTIVALDLAEK